MGAIQAREIENQNTELEITYGGQGNLFGGVDTSAPPAYIDPRCFTSTKGMMVVNNKLCAVSLQQLATPTLWSGTVGVRLLGFGTFYNSIYGQLNYALGYKLATFGTPGVTPTGVNYTFYLTSWNPETLAYNDDTFEVSLYDSFEPAVAASLTVPCVASSSVKAGGGTGATGTATVNAYGWPTAASLTGGTGYGVGDAVEFLPATGEIPADPGWLIVDTVGGAGDILTTHLATNTGFGYPTGSISIVAGSVEVAAQTVLKINGTPYSVNAYSAGATRASMIEQMAALITASDPNVAAASSVDGTSIIITARTAGAAGNAITVQDASNGASALNPPPFYFACLVANNLGGGQDETSRQAPRSFNTASSTSIGGVVYFANLGPMILQYSGPTTLGLTTMYQGVSVIRKFGGCLFGLGVIPALGFEVDDQDMMIAWSASGKFGIWSPVDGSGKVTGAGFQQLADVDKFLTGLVVSNNTAWVIRANGLSYVVASGNATAPFPVYHLGLGAEGEGSEIASLVTQYDMTGVFVGNTDVWQLAGQPSSIGEKIRSAIFAALQNTDASQLAATAGAFYGGGDEFPVAVFVIGRTLYIFNTSNGTWTTLPFMQSNLPPGWSINQFQAACLASKNITASTDSYGQNLLAVAVQLSHAGLQPPSFFTLQEKLPDDNSNSVTFAVEFPREEVAFGRDVTIDALYVSLSATLVQDITMSVFVNNVLYAQQTLLAANFTDVNAAPTEIQIFPTTTNVVTAKSPQVKLTFANPAGIMTSLVRVAKVALFGSFDPNQRPV